MKVFFDQSFNIAEIKYYLGCVFVSDCVAGKTNAHSGDLHILLAHILEGICEQFGNIIFGELAQKEPTHQMRVSFF